MAAIIPTNHAPQQKLEQISHKKCIHFHRLSPQMPSECIIYTRTMVKKICILDLSDCASLKIIQNLHLQIMQDFYRWLRCCVVLTGFDCQSSRRSTVALCSRWHFSPPVQHVSIYAQVNLPCNSGRVYITKHLNDLLFFQSVCIICKWGMKSYRQATNRFAVERGRNLLSSFNGNLTFSAGAYMYTTSHIPDKSTTTNCWAEMNTLLMP